VVAATLAPLKCRLRKSQVHTVALRKNMQLLLVDFFFQKTKLQVFGTLSVVIFQYDTDNRGYVRASHVTFGAGKNYELTCTLHGHATAEMAIYVGYAHFKHTKWH